MSGAVYVTVWELRRLIGRECADLLLKARGGTTLYVASSPRSNSIIVSLIGKEPASRLASHYAVGNKYNALRTSGAHIALPIHTFGSETKRQRVMLELGGDPSRTTVEICRKMGVSERTVRRWRAKHRAIEQAMHREAAE